MLYYCRVGQNWVSSPSARDTCTACSLPSYSRCRRLRTTTRRPEVTPRTRARPVLSTPENAVSSPRVLATGDLTTPRFAIHYRMRPPSSRPTAVAAILLSSSVGGPLLLSLSSLPSALGALPPGYEDGECPGRPTLRGSFFSCSPPPQPPLAHTVRSSGLSPDDTLGSER